MATVAVPQPSILTSHDISNVHNRLSCGPSTAANKLRLIRCLSDQNVRNKAVLEPRPNTARKCTETDILSMETFKRLTKKKEVRVVAPVLPVARARGMAQCNFGHWVEPDYIVDVNTVFPYPGENSAMPPLGQLVQLENGIKAVSVKMSCCVACVSRALREHFWVRCVYLFMRRCDCCHVEFEFDNLEEKVELVTANKQMYFMHRSCAEAMEMRVEIPQGGDVA
jgi:hypothetical protein